MAYTNWYRTGTINITNGSATVTGINTHFLTAGIETGATLRVDGQPYACEVEAVISDTELSLEKVYAGPTAEGASYSIDRNFQATTNAELAAKITALLEGYSTIDLSSLQTENKSSIVAAINEIYALLA